MRVIELDKAAEQIRRACTEGRRPFFFIVGAGISNPPIPLASEIERNCRTIALGYDAADESQGMSAVDRYSYWFDRAYEQPVLRQEYLRELIEGTPISHANFRLAHLLLEKQISNIVVTPNFDDFLSRALMLFGKPHIVCDHPKTVERINPEQDDIQILHVHGTYWFYDCCNLKDEIEKRARTSEQTNETMAFKLDDILSRRSPLVIGYSGWEGDVIMSALKRRLQTDLPYNLYWFCYKAEAIDSLPDWLKSHPRVLLVTSPAKPKFRTEVEEPKHVGDEPEQLGRKLLDFAHQDQILQKDSSEPPMPPSLQTKTAGHSEGKAEDPKLSAQQVLDRLIQSLALEAPILTSDPLGFFANYLHDLLPQDDADKATSNIYSFGSVMARIERAKQNEIIQTNELELEKVRDALRRSQYREAIHQGTIISRSDLDQRQLSELMAAMYTAAASLSENSPDEILGYDLAIGIGDALIQQDGDDPALHERIAKALVNKAFCFAVLSRNEDAIRISDEVIERFGERSEPALREQVAKALVNKGNRLGALNRYDEAVAEYDEVIRRFGEVTDAALSDVMAMAHVNRGYFLGHLNRNEEAITAYDNLIKLFGENTKPFVQEQVGRALSNKVSALNILGRNEESINACDELVNRFGKAKESVLREYVARALNNKVYRLGLLNRNEEAAAASEEMIKRFGEASESVLREEVAVALNSVGFKTLCQAKQDYLRGDKESGLANLLKARQKIEAALERLPENAVAIGNKGYIEFLLGDREAARETLTRAIGLGGKKVQNGELDDSHINELPEDEEFREMVLSIPLPEIDSSP